MPWLYSLGFLVLAGGIYAAWEYPRQTVAPDLAAVQQRLADFDARLTRLEQRPAPVASVPQADLGKLASRIDALDAKIADQAKITDQLQTKVGDQLKNADQAASAGQTELSSRVNAVSGKIDSLSGHIETGLDAIRQQTDHLAARVAALEKASGGADTVSNQLNRLARIQEATLALAAGRPLGDIPGAPPAVARFAHTAPPTMIQLRELFTQSEHAAIAAKQPDDTSVPLVDRIWQQAQGLVTVHRGENVVVGNPAAVTLGHARDALDAGDLKGAISTVEELKGQPRDAMAGWLKEARSLADARAALANMAGQS
ncbi:COG4223 family protein [Rhodopila globiformis]|uniref:Uncharacterized protein n=1 Tax=Rhodopila globiformis TaxID=1071 RepID=A0A2S6NI46_RHOGL|nr:mitofilin family membrane protein [Rhodopila globiformis]PPQ34311.1 hypothetical protein CCS01_11085 [Rhodopila globiformis]